MKQLNLQNPQNKLRNKFSKLGVKMIGLRQFIFQKIPRLEKM